jgi:hypothetical protein
VKELFGTISVRSPYEREGEITGTLFIFKSCAVVSALL